MPIAPPFRAFLADMAALGITPVTRGGRVYAVIAARSNLRWWLLPLDNRRAAAAGLEMLQPISTAAMVAKTGARILARCGPKGLLGQRQVRLSGVPDMADSFGTEDIHLAYFTGTNGPHRKTTLQVMDNDGVTLGYAKMSRMPHIRSYIHHEAEMLARVATLGLPSGEIPQVLALRDVSELTMLVTDTRKCVDVTIPLRLGVAHLRWLDDLRARTVQIGAAPLLETLTSGLKSVKTVAGMSWDRRITLALSALGPIATGLPLCFVHGDFTPWNCFVQGNQIYVFDWEYAHPAWPVGFDLAHFMLATIPPDKQLMKLPRLLADLAEIQFDNDLVGARHALLLSFVCHALFYLGRLTEVQGDLTDWTDGPVRAGMIDWLLESVGRND